MEKNSNKGKGKPDLSKLLGVPHWKLIRAYLIAYDLVAICLSYFLALLVRFDFRVSSIPADYLQPYLKLIPYYAVFCVIVFSLCRLYKSIWKFASGHELLMATMASFITWVAHILGMHFLFLDHEQFRRMPITYYVLGFFFQFVLTLLPRFSYRLVNLLRRKRTENTQTKRVMLIGAGAAGQMLLRNINQEKETNERVVCIIDDSPNAWGRYLFGVQVVGNRSTIFENVNKYDIDKIYIAIPSASKENIRDILAICKETGCEIKRLPSMYKVYNGEINASALREVSIEDLLGRATIQVDLEEIYQNLQHKTVLVTGGGGSIGSELCRQVAAHNVGRLIIFDVYENNAYDIQLELKKKYPNLQLETIIGSVRDSERVYSVFEKYHPDIVFHAAAHKHVPLMEGSPCEAIKNNAIGTYKTAYAAAAYGCKRFVLISTDKAVNPTNIMGASKRLCEMVIQTFNQMIVDGTPEKLPLLYTHANFGGTVTEHPLPEHVETEFVAVRFGNVLGSNGSVIPLFKKQIAEGGPVTVTHPDIIRYFMTIPEAVSLVLQAGVYAKGGEIFVLDMGSPVKIDDLARNLIKLSGDQPDVDIKIEYTGLRPGEKLYEEKLMAEEGMRTTPNHLIHIGTPIEMDHEAFLQQLKELMTISYQNDEKAVIEKVKDMVPTYHPQET